MVRREFPAGHTGAMEHLGTFLTLCCESWDGCGGGGGWNYLATSQRVVNKGSPGAAGAPAPLSTRV